MKTTIIICAAVMLSSACSKKDSSVTLQQGSTEAPTISSINQENLNLNKQQYSIYGKWFVDKSQGDGANTSEKAMVGRSIVFEQLNKDERKTSAKVSGNAGCNNYFGSATIDNNKEVDNIKFSGMASTKRYCPGVNDYSYLKLVEKSDSFKLSDDGSYLFLSKSGEGILLTFKRGN